jgi:metal-responsive CopG/Arc/MetJ family transcriptional regulator
MSKTQSFGVILPRELAYRTRIVAAMQGKSRSRLIRDLLEDYLEEHPALKNLEGDQAKKPASIDSEQKE